VPDERPRQPAQPVPPPHRAQLAVVGEHVAVELAGVIRDLDVERRLVPPSSAARIRRHLRREIKPRYPVWATAAVLGARPACPWWTVIVAGRRAQPGV
jgi:hypothetical protein